MNQLPTDPIREEHRELAPHLEHIEKAAALVTGWDLDRARRSLPQVVAFLRGDLVPHARVEEEVLYPAINQITGAPTTATMVVDHVVIGERIDALAASVESTLDDWDVDGAADISRQLAALAAIIGLHFRKEEEVLLPIIDSAMSVDEGHALFKSMGHTAHVH